MKRNILLISLSLLSTLSFAQTQNTYKGVVVDKDKKSLEAFSVVLFNTKDTTKQLYTNTFTEGNFDINFTPTKGEKYGAYLLSIGYKDAKIDLEKLKDTVTMNANAMLLSDAVVKGKRDVTTSLGVEGGVMFDVSNTYLSDLGNSTDLLNFIPGVQADKDGSITMVGVQGDVVVYINNIRIKEVEKLKMYKSEDIKSVEVLRSPGAKYKNASAVILIKTNKEYEGFSSLIKADAFITENLNYNFVPSIQASYTKGKVTASVSYNLDRDMSQNENTSSRIISKDISPDNWSFNSFENKDNNIYNHWYNANVDYNINEKNLLTFQYSGRYNDTAGESSSSQDISANSLGSLLHNKYARNSANNILSNTGHLYYKGTYSKKFMLEYNADYSNRVNDNNIFNTWQEGDASPLKFGQNTKSTASAFTTDILLTNTIKEKHTLSYGLEYSYLQDDVSSNTKEQVATSYKLNSTFVKTILEYKIQIAQPLSMSFGFNYLYNNLRDNNSSDKGKNYNSIVPYLGLQYYNAEKQFGIGLNVKYNNYQPDAGMLDDVTINYINPYEISTGNSKLENMKYTYVNMDFSYKKIFAGLMYQNGINTIFEHSTVEIQANNTPLITTKPNNGTPMNMGGVYIGYNNKIKLWTPSISVFTAYTHTQIPSIKGVNKIYQGIFCIFSMNNRFDLPKNFFIDLSGYYQPKGYILYHGMGEAYNIKFNVEKRLLNNQLRIMLLTKLANRWTESSSNISGISDVSNSKTSWYKFIGISASWRFNNHKEVQKAKESTYMNML